MELRGPGPPGHQCYCNYWFTQVLLYTRMLKETETEKTIDFFATFLRLVAFQLVRGADPWAMPTGVGGLLSKNGTIDGYAY